MTAPAANHLAVICWVVDPTTDQILLLHHRHFGWSCPGGHVEPGETLAKAARRELFEETGLRAEPTGGAFEVTWNEGCPRDPAVVDELHHFRFAADSAKPLVCEDGQPAQWFPIGALPHPHADDIDVLLHRIRG